LSDSAETNSIQVTCEKNLGQRRDLENAKGRLYCSSAMMLHYEGVSSFYHEAMNQNESFIGWSGVVEALTCAAMKVSKGFNNSMSKHNRLCRFSALMGHYEPF
jgi:hypothetical protein